LHVVAGVLSSSEASNKSEAVAEAERAIERALAPKKLLLVPREGRLRGSRITGRALYSANVQVSFRR